MEKSFVGKQGLITQHEKGLRKKRVMIAIQSDKAPVQSGETVFDDKHPIGAITSAAWGYRVKRNLAMAYIDPLYAVVGTSVQVMLLGEWVEAVICDLCLYDRENTKQGSDVG